MDITTHKSPEPPATEQIDNDAVTSAGAPTYSMLGEPPACERLNEVRNRHNFTGEDMVELKRLLHDSES